MQLQTFKKPLLLVQCVRGLCEHPASSAGQGKSLSHWVEGLEALAKMTHTAIVC